MITKMGSLSQTTQLHFVLFPFMAQGHMIPMVDIGKLLASRGAIVNIVTTPVNAARFQSPLARAKDSGLPVRVVELHFPCAEAGLPQGCENLDMLQNTKDQAINFLTACSMLQDQVEVLFNGLSPQPSCIISDMCLPFTLAIANKFNIPRITFHGFGSFALYCVRSVCINMEFLESITSKNEYFILPNFPDEIEFTKEQLPMTPEGKMKEFFEEIFAADLAFTGAIVNSFQELEPAYVEGYKKARGGGKVWCIGPVSLCNAGDLDKAQRGNTALTSELHQNLVKWLDSQGPSSVIYACLGSLCILKPAQVIELALGLEAAGKPFVWAIRGNENLEAVEKWIGEDKFEERTKGRGFLIRGWAPQVLILSHPAIGGFMTHCGWNSTLEGITAGLPLITWPLFADQFCNEKLVVQVLRIGVKVGAEFPTMFEEEEEIGVLIKKEDVEKAVKMLMDEGEEGKSRRERAKELGKLAKRAVEEGGSSYFNLTMLIEEIRQQLSKPKKSSIS